MPGPFTYEEVLDATKKYFAGDELVASTWINKYCLKDKDGRFFEKTPTDMHIRLAKEFARIDKEKYGEEFEPWYTKYLGAMSRFSRIVPQGSPMSAIGNPFQIMSASNCVVVDDPHDSIDGIMKSASQLAQLYKRRAGVGIDVSPLRPRGFFVNNAARATTGPISFMELFSFLTNKIAQEGRRGALMMTMSVHHPDIEEFASCKSDQNKITGANISVKLTDEFLNAVESNTDYEQRWPCEGEPKFRRMVNARSVWKTIIKYATLTADPGLMFWDRITKRLPAHMYSFFKTLTTNPCMPSWATVITKDGIRTIKDIKIGDVIWSGSKWTAVTNKWQSGIKDVYRYRTNAGVFYGTENHRIVQNGSKVEVGHASSIDISKALIEMPSAFNNLDVLNGIIIGDGTYHKASNSIYINVGAKDLIDYKNNHLMEYVSRITHHGGVAFEQWWVKDNLIDDNNMDILPKRIVPDKYFYGSFEQIRGFLRGLFSANGCVHEKYNRITLKSTSSKLIEQVQQMLSALGIASYITTNKSKDVEFENGCFNCRESYDINITKDRNRFRDLVGFIHEYKNNALNKICETACSNKEKLSYEIKSCDFVSNEPVFDITVDCAEHTFWSGGHLVSNCGEIPLSNDSCRLISINLLGYVRNAFRPEAYFDLAAFKGDVALATRMCDNLVDLELELVSKIISVSESQIEKELWSKLKESAERGRRIGLGTHGEADMLAQLSIKFDSERALKLAKVISEAYRNSSYMASVELAKQRGPFPDFSWDVEKDNEYIRELPDDVLEEMSKHGRRNISLLTRAPTGTVSMMSKCGEFDSFNISSGGEPVFRNTYSRRKRVNPSDVGVRVDHVDSLGESWMQFEIYHGNVLNWASVAVEDGKFKSIDEAIKNLPDFFVTSDKIDWQFRVDMQGVWSNAIDHSISSTINLPRGTSEEVVGNIYLRAWKSGLKGITVYVEGSKGGVLISKEEMRPSAIKRQEAPKRPNELPCDIHRVTYKGKHWLAAVGRLGSEPYEMFACEDTGDIGKGVQNGLLIKKARGRYALTTDEGSIHNIAVPEFGWATRLISTSLRHGVPIDYIVEQLNKEGTVADLNRVLARVLKKYIKDGKVRTSATCPECSSSNLIWQEGCMSCGDCSYRKCG